MADLYGTVAVFISCICRFILTRVSDRRYRCLKCFGFDMCQKCFFAGQTSKSHKLTHPMQEYCSTVCLRLSLCRSVCVIDTLDTHYNARRYSADSVIALIGHWIPFFEPNIPANPVYKAKVVLKISHSIAASRHAVICRVSCVESGRLPWLVGRVWIKTCL